MTSFLLPPGFRATDADDNPLAGGKYMFYAASTTTPKAVYSDSDLSTSLGSTVNLNSAGAPVSGSNTPVLIYLNTGAYKVELYDSDDTLLFTFDDIPGADEAEAEVTSAVPETPVISKTGAYTVTVNERGKLINANPTGGSFAITLPSAVTMGDNFRVGVRHNGSANQVSVVSSGSQFARAHKVLRSYSLTGMGETAWFVSDGSDWIVDGYHPPFMKATAPYFRVLDRLTAPPANPDAGARYLINGTPSGLWNTLGFAEHDIAEADGNGSWIQLTPETGWMAFDVDEEVTLQFKDGDWENFQIDPGTSTLKSALFQDQRSSGTNGGDAITGSWQSAIINTSVSNEIDDSSLASNKITLPAGTYEVEACKSFCMTKLTRMRFKTAFDDSVVIYSPQAYIGDYSSNSDQRTETGGVLWLKGRFTISETTDFALQYLCSETPADSFAGMGLGVSLSVSPEVYASVSILDLASLQGPKGDQGDQGNTGSTGIAGATGPTSSTAFDFDDATADADPGDGQLRLNNASFASATACYIDNLNRAGATISGWLDSFDNGGSSLIRGILLIQKAASTQVNFCIYTVSGSVVDGTGYRKLTIAHLASNGSFTNADELVVAFFSAGPPGSLEVGSTIDLDGNNITGTGDIDIDGTLTLSGVPVYGNSPINSQSTAYTTVLADAQKTILHPAADNNARTFTIDSNANVAYPVGTIIIFQNEINTVTIAITSDTLTLAGSGLTGSRSLAANGFAVAQKITSTKWVISGSGLS